MTFVLNAVDALAGDESFIALRSRRPRHRTLDRVEAQKRRFFEEANEAEMAADKAADEELEIRKKQLSERVQEIEQNDSLDPIAKNQMLRQAQEAEQQRLNLAEAKIQQTKDEAIQKTEAGNEEQDSFAGITHPALGRLAAGTSRRPGWTGRLRPPTGRREIECERQSPPRLSVAVRVNRRRSVTGCPSALPTPKQSSS